MNIVQYKGDNSGAGPSPFIWGDCPTLEILDDPGKGLHFFDNFMGVMQPVTNIADGAASNAGPYHCFTSDGGTILGVAVAGGGINLLSDGDDEGAGIRLAGAAFLLTSLGKKFWFECRIKTSTIANTKHGIFVGLMENTALSATVPIAAAGSLADKNFVGFHRLEGDGDYFDTVYKADGVTQVSLQTDAVVLEADTYVKIGMVAEKGVLTFLKNGVPLSTTYTLPNATGTDFPADITMNPVLSVLNATASTPGSTTAKWWRFAQLY